MRVFIYFAYCFVLLWPCLGQSIDKDKILKESVASINHALSSENRLELLPPIITHIYLSPKHKPCFRWSPHTIDSSGRSFSSKKNVMIDEPDFMLMENQWIIGWGSQNRIFNNRDGTPQFNATVKRSDVIVFGPTSLTAAYEKNGIVHQTRFGYFQEDPSTMILGAMDQKKSTSTFDFNEALALQLYDINNNRNQVLDKIAVGSPGNWDILDCKNLDLNRLTGLLMNDDGEYVFLTEKIAHMSDLIDQGAEGHDKKGIINALKEKDEIALKRRLSAISLLPRDRVREIMGDLGEMRMSQRNPDAVTYRIEQLLRSLKSVESGIESLKSRLPETDEMMKQFRVIQEFYEECLSSERLFSLTEIWNLLANGFQYLDGKWIKLEKIVYQNSLFEAFGLVEESEGMSYSRSHKQDLCLINGSGKLTKIRLDKLNHPSDLKLVSAITNIENEAVFFFPKNGLAKWNGEEMVWLDCSTEMKSMGSIIGCDNQGRLYFSKHFNRSGNIFGHWGNKGPAEYWVYTKDRILRSSFETGTYKLAPISRTNPRNRGVNLHSAVVDESGSIWFIALKGDFEFEDVSEGGEAPKTRNEYCLFERKKDGVTLCHLSRKELKSVCLIAGKDNSIIGAGEKFSFVVQDKKIHASEDLHTLTIESNHAMNVAAPNKNTLFPGYLDRIDHRRKTKQHPQCFKVGDVLWVNHKGRVNAYMDKDSLSFDKRISKLPNKSDAPLLMGPFDCEGDARAILLCDAENDPKKRYWIVQGKGIQIKEIPLWYDSGGKKVVHGPGFEVSPIIDYYNGTVYFYDSSQIIELDFRKGYTVHRNMYYPRMLDSVSGQLLFKYQGSNSYFWYLNKSEIRPFYLNFHKRLTPFCINNKNEMVCFTPEGLAWVDEERTEIVREKRLKNMIQPDAFIGQTGSLIAWIDKNGYLQVFDEP